MSNLTKSDCYNRNLIDNDNGFCAPFVVAEDDGTIHVGDCDNHETFSSAAGARKYCESARLGGDQLKRAQYAHDNDHRDNYAAEYHWHCDAGLQLDALSAL